MKEDGCDGDEWRYPRCPKSFPRGFQTKTFPQKYSQTLTPSQHHHHHDHDHDDQNNPIFIRTFGKLSIDNFIRGPAEWFYLTKKAMWRIIYLWSFLSKGSFILFISCWKVCSTFFFWNIQFVICNVVHVSEILGSNYCSIDFHLNERVKEETNNHIVSNSNWQNMQILVPKTLELGRVKTDSAPATCYSIKARD